MQGKGGKRKCKGPTKDPHGTGYDGQGEREEKVGMDKEGETSVGGGRGR